MRAILIDPVARSIDVVEYDGDYKSINKLIDAALFDCVILGDADGNTIYVDDEGLLNGKGSNMFKVHGNSPAYLVGKGLILAADDEGDSVACTLTLKDVRAMVSFGEPVRVNGEVCWLDDRGLSPITD